MVAFRCTGRSGDGVRICACSRFVQSGIRHCGARVVNGDVTFLTFLYDNSNQIAVPVYRQSA